MPSSNDRSTWRGLAERAEAICEAARHDPYDPRLDEEMQGVAGELAALHAGEESGSTTLDPEEREQRATTHAAAGEAWFALLDSKQALAEFDTALEVLGGDGTRSPACAAAQARALCGRGKCLVDLRRSAEAIAVLEASIGWYVNHSDPSDEAQQSLLSQALHTLGMAHADMGDHERALQVTAEAIELRERLADADAARYQLALSRSLRNLGNYLYALKRKDLALPVRERTVTLRREARQRRPTASATLALAQALKTLVDQFPDHPQALVALQEASDLCRELAASNRAAYLPDLAKSLNSLGHWLGEAGRHAEALLSAKEAVAFFRELAAVNRAAHLSDLALGLHNVGVRFGEVGCRAEALQAAEEAVELYRELAANNRGAFLSGLAISLINLGRRLDEEGRYAEALLASQDAVKLYRELAAKDRGAVLLGHARGVKTLSPSSSETGCPAEKLNAELHGELAASGRGAFLNILAMALLNLGLTLIRLGRHDEAGQAVQEAVELRRELVAANRAAFGRDLPPTLSIFGYMLFKAGHHADAQRATQEAVELSRELATADRGAFLSHLAGSLWHFSVCLGYGGRLAEALQAGQEGVDLYRELSAGNRGALSNLSSSLGSLGTMLGEAGRCSEAIQATQEAVDLCRELAGAHPRAFLADLADNMHNLGVRLAEDGRRVEAVQTWRECGALVLELSPDDPYRWVNVARGPTLNLGTPEDLRDWQLPLLRVLTEHREIAWSNQHAQVFLDLQAQVAARVWELLATLPAEEGELLDEAVAALVTTLHSPDLARWLDARGGDQGPLARLAELKREVIEAEQFLAALRKGMPGGGDVGWRAGSSGLGTEAQRGVLMNDIERQSAKAQALRQAFRDERARLVAEDPRFAATFQPVSAQTLRSIAGHARGGALLCVLELGGHGVGQPELSSFERSRSVAALLHADGRRTQLLELAGVHELAWHAQNYRPEALGVSRRGPLRGAPAGATRPVSDGACPPPITDLLAPRMSESFWAPLQQALQASGVAVERLHVCLHGTTQQLPLALRQAGDCPGLQVIPWPGLPYLRRAAMATTAKSESHTGADASAPWLVGHDCAWASEQPLPMVAVEAALLRDLLQRHGQPVQQIRLAAQLHGQASALVACCHGGAEQAQFDHALHLGQEPLTVRQIVQENLGPPLALLPACHAGRTDEDAAGNALGVAAAFMLAGTQVVAASSKAVPDLLQPWLSTLTVWHAMQGLPHHDAANIAREQFAGLELPEGYRSWLQQALPQAMATIQPGGEEDEHIRGVHAQTALEQVEERWPWEGETKDLFSADPARREEATRSVVQGILVPRGGEDGARALAAEAREMAAFVFVYGVDAHSSS